MAMTYPCAASDTASGATALVNWASAAYPVGVVAPAVTVTPQHVVTFSSGAGGDALFTDSYLSFDWTSTQSGGVVNAGLQIVLGQVILNERGTTGTLKAVVRVNSTIRISEVYLSAIDLGNAANSFQSGNLQGSLSTSWADLSAAFNPSGWTANPAAMLISLSLLGTAGAANVGQTRVDVACLEYIP